ncbi:ribosome maturation factor RimP [Bacillus carboniphilus]|uniref:Ribosome maturation factor RimP n=1 Tax=Bacillus carboniphilus TaxID=86663 RepID=A0ABY9JXJ4_9BACI|nr:ribosome maturation factor RimP [Bacillus carboniphilus]WLR43508.1 ribosome maturation factor RimP [Bacillus carboniphilus]
MSKVVEEVEPLVLPILEELNLHLVDMEYVKEGPNWFLRIFIDSDTGINIEECGLVSERLSEKLDQIDPIPHQYYLEVSSPGAERPLKNDSDFVQSIGKNVAIKLYQAIDGKKNFEGELVKFEENIVTLSVKIKASKKLVEIPKEKIASARLAIIF